MLRRALILIPEEAETPGFENSAFEIRRIVYEGNALIIRVSTSGGWTHCGAALHGSHGSDFSMSSVSGLGTVITVSHGAMGDGPLFNHCQPWGRSDTWSATDTELSDEAKQFWHSVSGALGPGGKIILIGCNMGARFLNSTYARRVNGITGRPVYVSTQEFPAADSERAVFTVYGIEYGEGWLPRGISRSGRQPRGFR